MAKWGSVDYKQFKELADSIEKFQKEDMDTICRNIAKNLAARLLRMVRKRTPVGQYEVITYTGKDGSTRSYNEGMQGGTLRRNWKIEATITRKADGYEIRVINPTEYAEYVESGHRQEPGRFVPQIGKSLSNGFTLGRYMLRDSENELRGKADAIAQIQLEKEIRKLFQND